MFFWLLFFFHLFIIMFLGIQPSHACFKCLYVCLLAVLVWQRGTVDDGSPFVTLASSPQIRNARVQSVLYLLLFTSVLAVAGIYELIFYIILFSCLYSCLSVVLSHNVVFSHTGIYYEYIGWEAELSQNQPNEEPSCIPIWVRKFLAFLSFQ